VPLLVVPGGQTVTQADVDNSSTRPLVTSHEVQLTLPPSMHVAQVLWHGVQRASASGA